MAVDTIRFYQGKGLLDSPRREGRVTWYGEPHLERLRRIRDLQRRGFTLTVIRRFLEGELEPSDESLVAAVTHPASPQTLTLDELADRSGVAVPLLKNPPPTKMDELSLIVLLEMFIVPLTAWIAPAPAAVFFTKVQWSIFMIPLVKDSTAPPVWPVFLVIMQSLILTVPLLALWTAPPPPVVVPFWIVIPERLTSMVRGPGPISKIDSFTLVLGVPLTVVNVGPIP